MYGTGCPRGCHRGATQLTRQLTKGGRCCPFRFPGPHPLPHPLPRTPLQTNTLATTTYHAERDTERTPQLEDELFFKGERMLRLCI